MKIKKSAFRYNFLMLYLALGSIVWFASFSLGILKSILLILVILSNFIILKKSKTYVYFKYFLIFILIISLSFFFNLNKINDETTDVISLYYTYFLNYLFLILGYAYFNSENSNSTFLRNINWIIVPLCFLTISNLILNFPNWYAPNLVEHFEEMSSLGYEANLAGLYSSGFGLGRTGWATTLSQYLPLVLLLFLNKSKSLTIVSYLIILLSVFISGSRGGFMISFLISIIILVKTTNKLIFPLLLLVFGFAGFIALENSELISFYRLDSGDITSGRSGQYLLVPEMLLQGGLFGLGIDGSHNFSKPYNFDYALHNVYLRFFIDYGWVIGTFVLVFSFKIFRKIIRTLLMIPFKGNEMITIFSLILLGGLIAGLTEPSAVFEARSWWVIWWFSCGAFLNLYKRIVKK